MTKKYVYIKKRYMMKLFFIIVVIINLMSCSKEKSNSWAIFEMNIINPDNSGSLTAKIKLKFLKRNIITGGTKTETIYLGESVNGKLYKEIKLPINSEKMSLHFYSSSQDDPLELYYSIESNSNTKYYQKIEANLDKRKINYVDIIVHPLYKYYYGFKNVNYYDQTDSIWLTNANHDNFSFISAGYIDSVYNNFLPLTTKSPTTNLYYKIKRNGVVEYGSQEYNLSTTLKNCIIEF